MLGTLSRRDCSTPEETSKHAWIVALLGALLTVVIVLPCRAAEH